MKTGITGGIGSGKSYVCKLLAQRGIEVYDCDAAAKRLIRTSPRLRQQLKALIGSLDKAAISRGILAERTIDANEYVIESALDQAKGKGGFMVDLNIGKTIRLKTGQLSINLMITNLLNNTKLCTGGYEQGRSSYSINSNDGGVNTSRLYRFDRNPKKYYAYGINGMLNIGYRF
jgi:hypothetical protein